MTEWTYGNKIKDFPIDVGDVYRLPDGSALSLFDIVTGGSLPDYFKGADCIFIDPPGNTGCVKSYYKKAGIDCPVQNFTDLAEVIKRRIAEINPERIFVEAFAQNQKYLLNIVQTLFPCVKVYNATYYHKPDCKCTIIQGTQEEEDYGFEGMDEWDVVYKLCRDVKFNCIADFFMGQGLVAEAAFTAGKKFVGSDMNPNRLAVGISIVDKIGGKWNKTT